MESNQREMRIDTKYDIGQLVFLKTDSEQHQRIIIQITINQLGLQYNLRCGTEDSWHFDFEFTTEQDVLKSIG